MKITLISTSVTPSDQGIRTISSLLKKYGHKVKIIFLPYTENYKKLYKKSVLKQILEIAKDSELIGVSAYASTSKRAEQVIGFLKKLNVPIVYGGIHATISPRECINHCNIACVGEGEDAFLELVEKLEKREDIGKIQNLWIRYKDVIFKNPVRPLREKLDELPFADYEIEDHYILERGRLIPFEERHLGGYIFFLTGRGCPYGCAYCSNHFLNTLYEGKGKTLRWHSPDYIIENVLYLRKKYPSLKVFDIRDDTFSLRPLSQIKYFCELYKQKVNIRFKCLADPKTLTEEKARLLADAGCTDIIIGIQGSEKVNQEIYLRNQTDEDVLRTANILHKFPKIAVMYDIITCNPYETNKDILNLIELIREIPPPFYLSVNNLVFFTGTELYQKAKVEGIIKKEKDSAADLNYWDRFKHIKLKKKNEYLTLILNLMRGSVTKRRIGLIPRFILKKLLREKRINFHTKHKSLTYCVGFIINIFDFLREKILKPLYRNFIPVKFRVWYDQIRYRV
ncbi:MAG: radical SAM protein [Candidatus Nanoarchaeia archaeon]|nr:radical SAM protein [Candidatus Nanoarchaeia archaeon]